MPRLPRRYRRTLVLASLTLAAVMTFTGLTGCGRYDPLATPLYGTSERFSRINRNFNLEGQMLMDDIDHILLLRPTSDLTSHHIP